MRNKFVIVIVVCLVALVGFSTAQELPKHWSVVPNSTILFYGESLNLTITGEPNALFVVDVRNETGETYRTYQDGLGIDGTLTMQIYDFDSYSPGNYSVSLIRYGTNMYLANASFYMVYDEEKIIQKTADEARAFALEARDLAIANNLYIDNVNAVVGQVRFAIIVGIIYMVFKDLFLANAFRDRFEEYLERHTVLKNKWRFFRPEQTHSMVTGTIYTDSPNDDNNPSSVLRERLAERNERAYSKNRGLEKKHESYIDDLKNQTHDANSKNWRMRLLGLITRKKKQKNGSELDEDVLEELENIIGGD